MKTKFTKELSAVFISLMVMSGAVSAQDGSPFENNTCADWSPDPSSVKLNQPFVQYKECTNETRKRSNVGTKQAWSNIATNNYDWASVDEKYNCTEDSTGFRTCLVKREKSEVVIARDSQSGMLKIESTSKQTKVEPITDRERFAPPPVTPPPAAVDKVDTTYEECTVTGTSNWLPAPATVTRFTTYTQTRTVTETCTTYSKWFSGKITTDKVEKSTGIESRKAVGTKEICGGNTGTYCK
jgi:hypothetical protein